MEGFDCAGKSHMKKKLESVRMQLGFFIQNHTTEFHILSFEHSTRYRNMSKKLACDPSIHFDT